MGVSLSVFGGVCFAAVLAPFLAVSAARVGCVLHGFSAPLALYNRLSRVELSGTAGEVNVCVGKEWYRFGSSFFLPSASVKLRFIKSGFDGLLPQVREGERGEE